MKSGAKMMNLPSHLKIFIAGCFFSIGGNIILGVVNYLTRRTMALTLPKFDYGCFYGAFAIVSILLVFLDQGVTDAGTLLISRNPERRKSVFFALWRWKLIAGVIVGGVLAAFSPFVSEHYLHGMNSTMFFFLSLYVIAQAQNGLFISYTTGRKEFKTKSLFQIIKALLLLALVWLSVKWLGAVGAALSYLLSAVLIEPFHIWWVLRCEPEGKFEALDGTLRRSFISLIGAVAFITFAQTLLMHTNSMMLISLSTPESTAVFNVAMPVAQLFLSMMVFHLVFLPLAVDMVQRKEYGKLRLYATCSIVISLLLLPVVYIFFKLTGSWLITLLFNRGYAGEAAEPLVILVCGFLFNALGAFISQILIAMKKLKSLLAGSIVTLLLNLALNYTLIRRMDVTGAAWATALSYLFFVLFVIVLFYSASTPGCGEKKETAQGCR